MEVQYHPLFEHWLTELADGDEEIFGEVMALLVALEQHGRGLDDETRDESHPIVTALGNHWYPPNIAEYQSRLEHYARQHTDLTPIVKRGNR